MKKILYFIDAEKNTYPVNKAKCFLYIPEKIVIFSLKDKINDEKTVRLLEPIYSGTLKAFLYKLNSFFKKQKTVYPSQRKYRKLLNKALK